MTFTQDSESEIAGLSVVLRSSHAPRKLQPLTGWLSEFNPALNWVPLNPRNGVTRIMAVLPEAQPYPELMQTICQQIGMSPTIEWQGHPYDMTGIEVDSHSLHVLQIPIAASESLPPTLGRAIHALCLDWIGLANESLATQLHQADSLPLTLTMRSISAKQMVLRIGLLQKDLLAPLLWGLSQHLGSEITLTDIPCRIGKTIEILQTSSYEMLSQVSPQRMIDLQFLTPTSFKQGRAIQPFPLPDLVFGSLLRRWNAFTPVELQFPQQAWNGITAAYELKTYAMKMKGGAEIGAQGWARYEFSNEAQAQIATVLAHFAQFSGVGRKTAMGMGLTKRMELSKPSAQRSVG
ncbi:CRISPR system precrRNA processing endoribonuclease RAMP protein Cas6 [Leptolyngbya sp. FACHB-711]|uniref:CRISPR system precrRNA processing endoribonuclease RAMP protein Cas6 n=1 Tax=Leptolyngbya sp. FACHB-711 TaxID=2692813 RepID=UPI001684CBB9|nr:CRISPR system precrRNA processing endoribonuclease RAMP protein Cas6 [Leptolyngbya sp. FACHB-711]MBD2027013.1 CRISPR system precrRNA processing endoribonuclease RAMP protein Cas6 [Leptolyngbya sp. FACHB-711]